MYSYLGKLGKGCKLVANDLIIKSNTLINASYSMTLAEQRLIALAIIKIREIKNLDTGTIMLEVRASDYMEMFGVDRATAYQALKDATDKLYERDFEYEVFFVDRKGDTPQHITNVPPKVMGLNDWSDTVKSRWLSQILYNEKHGCVLLSFTNDILPYLLDLKTYFTQYYLSQTVELTSSYAYRLFEIIMQWKSVGKTPVIPLQDLRGRLGVGIGQYSEMHNFKKRVLDVAVKQVSKGEYEVTYKQHKTGRSISGIEFFLKSKEKATAQTLSQRDPKTIDWLTGKADVENKPLRLTSPQIEAFAPKIVAKIGSWHAHMGEGSLDYLSRVKLELGNSEKAEFYRQYLIELGFKI